MYEKLHLKIWNTLPYLWGGEKKSILPQWVFGLLAVQSSTEKVTPGVIKRYYNFQGDEDRGHWVQIQKSG